MSRRSPFEMATLNLSIPAGNEGYWRVIRELDRVGPWDQPTIVGKTRSDRASVKDFVLRLLRGGIAEIVGERPQTGTGPTAVKLYRLRQWPVETPRLDRAGTPLTETSAETLWRTMRMHKVFTARELSQMASGSANIITEKTAQRYVSALSRAGIVVSTGQRGEYRLMGGAGHRAPIIMKCKLVFEPNRRVILGDAFDIEVAP